MAHAHLLSDNDPAPAPGVPASAAQIFVLIELVRPISALAEMILARQAELEPPPAAAAPKTKKGSVAATLDAIATLDGDE